MNRTYTSANIFISSIRSSFVIEMEMREKNEKWNIHHELMSREQALCESRLSCCPTSHRCRRQRCCCWYTEADETFVRNKFTDSFSSAVRADEVWSREVGERSIFNVEPAGRDQNFHLHRFTPRPMTRWWKISRFNGAFKIYLVFDRMLTKLHHFWPSFFTHLIEDLTRAQLLA